MSAEPRGCAWWVSLPFDLLSRWQMRNWHRYFWRRLKQKGRVISVQGAAERLRRGQGALIVEATAPGFPTRQFWWTDQPEAFLTVPDTCPDDRVEPIEHELNFNHFLDEDSCAMLLPITFYGFQSQEFLEEQTGFRTSLWISSFWVYAERHRNKRRRS